MTEKEALKLRSLSEAVSEERCQLLELLTIAISYCTDAKHQAAALSDEGQAGTERLLELFFSMQHPELMNAEHAYEAEILLEALTALCAAVLLHPGYSHQALGIYLEVQYLLDDLMDGEWFE